MLQVVSSAFVDGGRIPPVYAQQAVDGGENVSIPLSWSGMPGDTQSIAVSIIDHSPVAHEWVHWVVVDIPAATSGLAAGASGSTMPAGSRELLSGSGAVGYSGPKPPPGSGDHPYEATVYALDVPHLEIADSVTAADIARAVSGHVLASDSVTGIFSR